MSARPTDSITDFGQFNALRRGARANDEAAVRKAAQQFEALLTQQMLKSARAALPGDPLTGGGQTDFYQDLFDQQMAVHLSSGKGLGLADLLVRQLRGHDAAAGDDAQSSGSLPSASTSTSTSRSTSTSTPATSAAPAATAAPPASGAASGSDARSAFVQAIRPHAERAARELGVPARVLIAQAALETGWGRHAMRGADGQPTFNFFGIKADKRWEGGEVRTTTTEYVDGQAQRQRADFRTYASAGEAFDNYVDFLKSNPRYTQALRHGGSAANFVHGLQQAGYATDPAYASKILRIANGPAMQLALGDAGDTLSA
ncbi:flagellar assembly peptidoglycan hydrolase FlgJ [Solimonas flava]|uniref:flagellar assembly peptidoglycan hydrolase FlgJ n=1 Tax=Solimonas flava TaxID=415849 RepID=UPI00041856C0|nr:flagellar assembly peptidoglycan hydrolase FlgJ [Solimonas flava]